MCKNLLPLMHVRLKRSVQMPVSEDAFKDFHQVLLKQCQQRPKPALPEHLTEYAYFIYLWMVASFNFLKTAQRLRHSTGNSTLTRITAVTEACYIKQDGVFFFSSDGFLMSRATYVEYANKV